MPACVTGPAKAGLFMALLRLVTSAKPLENKPEVVVRFGRTGIEKDGLAKGGFRVHITPEPPPEDREAILRAVRALLDQEAALARPPLWTLAGWLHKRTGVRDLGRWLPNGRRWALAARIPWGGREYPGLVGRGDAR